MPDILADIQTPNNVSRWRTSVGAVKGRGGTPPRSVPAPGTRCRAVFDLFVSKPLVPLSRSTLFGQDTRRQTYYAVLEELRETYGLDVRIYNQAGRPARRADRQHLPRAEARWWLVGYVNSRGEYVDLLASRF